MDGVPSPNPNFPQEIKNVTGNVEITVCNKNIIKVSNANSLLGSSNYNNYTINDATGVVSLTGKSLFGIKCKVKPSTQYTAQYLLSEYGSGNKKIRIREYSSEPFEWAGDNFIQQSIDVDITLTNPKKSVTTSANTQWIVLVCYMETSAVGEGVTVSNWQVAEGTDEVYEEHKEQTILFPLAENQKLMEGDYLADDGVHHVRGQIVLDGTETWNKDTNQDNLSDYFYISNVGINRDNINSVYCNYFVKGSLSAQGYWATTVFGITINKTETGIVSTDTKQERIDKFKAWLSGHNVVVEYELAEETLEAYTTEQQAVWNQIQALKSYNDTTHISQEYDELPAILDIVALKNI